MGSTHLFVLLSALALIVLPSPAIGKVFMVGDEMGWTIGYDYKGWARGKDFHVGDHLVFRYPMGAHNVYKVNATDFQSCGVPLESEALTSGHDVVTLITPRRKWYVCGVGKHCQIGGQKLFINVQPEMYAPTMAPAMAPSIAPSPANFNYRF